MAELLQGQAYPLGEGLPHPQTSGTVPSTGVFCMLLQSALSIHFSRSDTGADSAFVRTAMASLSPCWLSDRQLPNSSGP